MDMKSTMIELNLLRTNQALQAILTNQYINTYGNEMAYTIGGQQAVDEMQQNLMG